MNGDDRPGGDRRALVPMVRLARRRSGRHWRDTLLLVVAVALPVSLGALVLPVVFSPDPLSLAVLLVLAAAVALSVGAVLATSTKRRILRYGRLAAIGADPTQVRLLLVLESALPAAAGWLAGTTIGLLTSITIGPLRWLLDDDARAEPAGGDGWSLVLVVAGIAAVAMAVVTAIGLWLASAPAAAMAVRAPIESLGARAPEPRPARFQGWIGLGLVVGAIAYCLTTDSFAFGLLTLAVIAVFAGIHLLTAPTLIHLDRWSGPLPHTLRLAVRNAARNRTRFGRLTLASLATVALGVMAAAGVISDSPDNPPSGYGWAMDDRFVLLPEQTLGDDGERIARSILDVEHEAELQLQGSDLVRIIEQTGYGYSATGIEVALATPELLAALDADAETRAAIDRGAVVLADGSAGPVGVDGRDGLTEFDTHSARLGLGANQAVGPGGAIHASIGLVSPDRAAELGIRSGRARAGRYLLVVAERPISGEQRDRLVEELGGPIVVADRSDEIGGVGIDRVLTGVTAFFLLGFGLIGAALSGAETDQELSALVASGAPPSIRRRFRAVQTGLQLLVAGVVGAPLGVLLFWAVTRTDPTVPEPIVPTFTIVALAVVVPLVTAALVALFTADGSPAVSRRALA